MKPRAIVDSSVAIKWVVPEIGSADAVDLREQYHLCAPELIIAEIANILWKKHQRNELSIDEANLAAIALANSNIELLPMSGLLADATRLAIDLSHPAYDCVYVAAAAYLNCPFFTADLRLLTKLRRQGFDQIEFYALGGEATL